MGIVVKSKIVMKDLGEPALVKALPEGQNKLILGTIVGIVDNVKISKATDGITELVGLKGTFEAVPADEKRDTVRSGVCFLGEAFQADILALLNQENGPDSVRFGFEIGVVKAGNPAGYSWILRPLMAAAEADPLAELRTMIAASAAEQQKQLEAPKADEKKSK